MIHTDFYQTTKEINHHEQTELKKAVEAHGGIYQWNEEDDHPIIAVNLSNVGPLDVQITKVHLKNGEIKLEGYGTDCGCDLEFGAEEPFAGHLSYIMDYMPQINGINDVTIQEIPSKHNTQIINTFFYYIWNTWGTQEECQTVFGDMTEHFWPKWKSMSNRLGSKAFNQFYADLTLENQEKLVTRACQVYNGRIKRK